MRRLEFKEPIEEMSGRLNKHDKESVIFRRKYFRDEKGNIIGKASKERVTIENHRNYTTNPMSEAEAKTVDAFKKAVAQYNIEKNDPERMAYWKARFSAQLRKPDSEAPIDPKTQKRRKYLRLDMFIRAMLQLQFRAQ